MFEWQNKRPCGNCGRLTVIYKRTWRDRGETRKRIARHKNDEGVWCSGEREAEPTRPASAPER